MTDTRLTAENVERIFIACLGSHMDCGKDMVKVRGITFSVLLKKDALAQHTDEIVATLEELPPQFHEHHGGGYTFLSGHLTRDDRQWGEHTHVEQLIVLGIGIGRVKFPLPRNMWDTLPGGMPYFMVTTEQQVENQ